MSISDRPIYSYCEIWANLNSSSDGQDTLSLRSHGCESMWHWSARSNLWSSQQHVSSSYTIRLIARIAMIGILFVALQCKTKIGFEKRGSCLDLPGICGPSALHCDKICFFEICLYSSHVHQVCFVTQQVESDAYWESYVKQLPLGSSLRPLGALGTRQERKKQDRGRAAKGAPKQHLFCGKPRYHARAKGDMMASHVRAKGLTFFGVESCLMMCLKGLWDAWITLPRTGFYWLGWRDDTSGILRDLDLIER